MWASVDRVCPWPQAPTWDRTRAVNLACPLWSLRGMWWVVERARGMGEGAWCERDNWGMVRARVGVELRLEARVRGSEA